MTKKDIAAVASTKEAKSFTEFLHLISDGDMQIKKQLLQMGGVSLLPTKKFRKAFFLDGDGGNGKSAMLNVLAKVHGDSKISRLKLDVMSGQRASFAAIGMVNKTVNIIDDLSAISLKENGTFKSMVAGEGIMAEVKGGKVFNFYNEATFIAGGNGVPALNDKGSSTAIMDRMVIIPLNHKFAKTPAGVAKGEYMLTDGVIEIVASIMAHSAHMAQKHGLITSDKTSDAIGKYEVENDSVLF